MNKHHAPALGKGFGLALGADYPPDEAPQVFAGCQFLQVPAVVFY